MPRVLHARSRAHHELSEEFMNAMRICQSGAAILVLAVCSALCAASDPLGNETPQSFTPLESNFDYIKREAMIPRRDVLKLYTLILIPRGAARAPILLTRTPYSADARIAPNQSEHLAT